MLGGQLAGDWLGLHVALQAGLAPVGLPLLNRGLVGQFRALGQGCRCREGGSCSSIALLPLPAAPPPLTVAPRGHGSGGSGGRPGCTHSVQGRFWGLARASCLLAEAGRPYYAGRRPRRTHPWWPFPAASRSCWLLLRRPGDGWRWMRAERRDSNIGLGRKMTRPASEC